MSEKSEKFQKLVDVMERLRSPDGCQWDREQDSESLKTYIVEEAYEVINAIESGNPTALKEELGDLLLQIIFQAQIARENNEFDIYEVIESVTKKLISRHPHVFEGLQVNGTGEILRNWEGFKRKEGKGILNGVPKTLPALLKAFRVQEKVSRVGFDWNTLREVFTKLEEELTEFRQAVEKGTAEEMATELGDLLFTIVNISRFLKIDPEEALRSMIDRFIDRFSRMEESAMASGRDLKELNIQEMDELWEEIKSSK